jgi:quercetin dioxygenase-like cupin family protein
MAVRRIQPSEIPHDRSAIEGDGFTATVAWFDPPTRVDTWHHHGGHDIIAYVIEGHIRVETADENEAVQLGAGDLVHIERGTVHREAYEGHIGLVGFDVGTGPGRIDVGGIPRMAERGAEALDDT